MRRVVLRHLGLQSLQGARGLLGCFCLLALLLRVLFQRSLDDVELQRHLVVEG